MKSAANIPAALLAVFFLLSCGQGKGGRTERDAMSGYRPFATVQVPSICGDRESAAQYLAVHFWDEFFGGGGVSDTSAVLGVRNAEFEKAFSDYAALLDNIPMRDAQDAMLRLFEKVSETQKRDSASHVYTLFSQAVEKYLYDPNSPVRNEDYFLPYVKALSISELTREELRPSYEYQARMCSLNRFGTTAPDFGIRTPDGRRTTLHSVKAENTVLFFSNPGCSACGEITDALESIPDVRSLVADNRLAIVNVYIDEELDKWREYLPNYPEYWICGYDYKFIIRKDILYNVRAIPSLYLLDAEKRVVCKDAPTEKLINILIQRLCQ